MMWSVGCSQRPGFRTQVYGAGANTAGMSSDPMQSLTAACPSSRPSQASQRWPLFRASACPLAWRGRPSHGQPQAKGRGSSWPGASARCPAHREIPSRGAAKAGRRRRSGKPGAGAESGPRRPARPRRRAAAMAPRRRPTRLRRAATARRAGDALGRRAAAAPSSRSWPPRRFGRFRRKSLPLVDAS